MEYNFITIGIKNCKNQDFGDKNKDQNNFKKLYLIYTPKYNLILIH